MRAVYYSQFNGPISIEQLADPSPPPAGAVIAVRASGLCRSDWHGWHGHDADIRLPHVPGHEFSGEVVAVGAKVRNWQRGDRVTLPFICACGNCPQCQTGNHQVCDRQFQPGFTHWGSFAEQVAIDHADTNLVRLPENMSFDAAASLGCRFATAFRAVVDQGRAQADQWVAVHGCGGVGLSAIMIANALGARVIAVDIREEQLALARKSGALATLNSADQGQVAEAILQLTDGGAHLSLDAGGFPDSCFNSVACLRKRGRHVQVGLMSPDQRNARVPMDRVVAHELEMLGSHGMQAHRYPAMLELLESGHLQPETMIQQRVSLDKVPVLLAAMNRFDAPGITIIHPSATQV